MLYDYIIDNYKEAEPIFFADIKINNVTKQALNQQLKVLCDTGKLRKYDTGIYYLPKKSRLSSMVGPSADTVARYKYISRRGKINGFYSGNTLANRIGMSTQVPRQVEIVSNNVAAKRRCVSVGKRNFIVRRPITPITEDNVYTLQILDLMKNLDTYLDYDYKTAKERIAEFIELHNISKQDLDKYIRLYPVNVFKYYYELELDDVFTHRR